DRPLDELHAVVEAEGVDQLEPGGGRRVGGLDAQRVVIGQIRRGPLEVPGAVDRRGRDGGGAAVALAAHVAGEGLVRDLLQERVGDLVAGTPVALGPMYETGGDEAVQRLGGVTFEER